MRSCVVHQGGPIGLVSLDQGDLVAGPLAPLPALGLFGVGLVVNLIETPDDGEVVLARLGHGHAAVAAALPVEPRTEPGHVPTPRERRHDQR